MTKKFLFPILLIVLLASCGGNDSTGTPTTTATPVDKVDVVATTSILADFASVVGGSKVEVYTLVKPGFGVHDYRPTAYDIEVLSKADLVIRNGVGLDAWLEKALIDAKSKLKPVDASTNIQIRKTANPEYKSGDPHIWHSPQNAKLMVDTITRALMAADKANESTYRTTQRSYNSQLDALRLDITQTLEAVTSQKVVMNHDSLGYYMAEFGLSYPAVQVNNFASPDPMTPAETAALAAVLKSEALKAMFAEPMLPSKNAESIAAEAGVKLVKGEQSIYGDSLGFPGSEAETYLEMQRHNTNVLAINLS
jgi:ABC-type Zn uptake system ZnuABC Zn-binding protein ZnuA